MSLAFYSLACPGEIGITKAYVGSVLHGGSPGRDLGGVTLDKCGEDGVGKCELSQVLGDILLHFVLLETGCCS